LNIHIHVDVLNEYTSFGLGNSIYIENEFRMKRVLQSLLFLRARFRRRIFPTISGISILPRLNSRHAGDSGSEFHPAHHRTSLT
jgi:hypothetical protein